MKSQRNKLSALLNGHLGAVRLAAVIALAVGIAGCRPGSPASTASDPAAPPAALSETSSWGPATVHMEVTPAQVHLDRDLFLTIRLSAPASMRLALPSLSDRISGFNLASSFDSEPATAGGQTIWERRARLIPVVAGEYRIAILPVTYTDERVTPALTGWFPTRPIVLAVAPLVTGDSGDAIDASVSPVWIRPPARVLALYAAAILGLLVAGFLLWKLLTRVREEVRVRRMSPRERALRELEKLLAKDLLGQGRLKDFYVELTMVVRRYIERQHKIRAPEQTTDEFLADVALHRHFGA